MENSNTILESCLNATSAVVKASLQITESRLKSDFSSLLEERLSAFAPTAEAVESIKKQIMETLSVPTTIEVKSDLDSHKIEGIFHEKLPSLIKKVQAGFKVYMHGPAGTGKSHIARQIAEALGLDFYCSQKVSTVFQLEGYGDAEGHFVATPFYEAFVKGGLFLLDEFDASDPDAVTALNMALANGSYSFPVVGLKHAHPDFRCMAAGNTIGHGSSTKYTGRYPIDEATRNRFIFVELGYSTKVEQALAGGNMEFLDFIHCVRKVAGDVIETGYRSIEQVLGLEALGCPIEEAIEEGFIKGVDSEMLRTYLPQLDDKLNGNPYFMVFRKLLINH